MEKWSPIGILSLTVETTINNNVTKASPSNANGKKVKKPPQKKTVLDSDVTSVD
jgi:hypothetical protein